MKDSETLLVWGDTEVGWDANVPINETLDENGNVPDAKRGFGIADPRAPKARVYDDPSVEELRESSGITMDITNWIYATPMN